MVKYSILGLGFIALIGLSSCSVPVEQKVSLVRMGTAMAVATAFTAIPDVNEANIVAQKTRAEVLNKVLPIIDGDEKVLISSLENILKLKFFESESMFKVKVVIESALPLLKSVVPVDLIEKGQEKLSAESKAYIKSFFSGIVDGCNDYLAETRDVKVNYSTLRANLGQ